MHRRIRRRILKAISNFIRLMDEGNSPRWIILLLDLTIQPSDLNDSAFGQGYVSRVTFSAGSVYYLGIVYDCVVHHSKLSTPGSSYHPASFFEQAPDSSPGK